VHAANHDFWMLRYFRKADPSSGQLPMLAGAGINGR
jgi:hypothetical protein